MKKIPTIFVRDWNGDPSRVTAEPNPECAWVFAGEGVATRKVDGACCMVRGGRLFKRREVKAGQLPPIGFEVADSDDETGKVVGWVPVGDGPDDEWFREAWTASQFDALDGTYELLGPKVQGNPERVGFHKLVRHGEGLAGVLPWTPPRTYEGLSQFFREIPGIEGIVWHHPDGRMAKIKVRDFGLRRA